MPTPYDLQLAQRQSAVEKILADIPHASTMQWLLPAASSPSHYRTKAKFAIGGTAKHPTLGITGPAPTYAGVDLPHCLAHTDAIARCIEPLKEFIRSTGIEPYDIAKRSGELKHILVTQGSDEALMIRFVMRSKRELAKLRSRLPLLHSLIPALQVVTVNILPIHAALVEGDEEIVITEQTTLPMLVGDVELHLGPRSFSQTNTGVASELYR
ncbi:MAG: SAM-dependent methyltransferase, partial [Actinomyces sp.]|nr:SAM-dependent methyltransferase [Actinomyces sp.]